MHATTPFNFSPSLGVGGNGLVLDAASTASLVRASQDTVVQPERHLMVAFGAEVADLQDMRLSGARPAEVKDPTGHRLDGSWSPI